METMNVYTNVGPHAFHESVTERHAGGKVFFPKASLRGDPYAAHPRISERLVVYKNWDNRTVSFKIILAHPHPWNLSQE